MTSETTRIFNVELRKKFQRAMQEDVAQDHIAAMIAATNTPKWTLELVSGVDGSTEWYKQNGNLPTEVSLFFRLTGPNTQDADIQANDRLHALAEAAHGNRKIRRLWYIHRVDGHSWEPMTVAQKIERRQERGEGLVEYADVSMPNAAELKEIFKDIYGVEDQLTIILNKFARVIENDFRRRSHCLLIGKPGCGKSHTLMTAKNMFNEDAVLVIDGTAMTSAGIIDLLKDIETMPRFLFIEEIDKADSAAIMVLLGMMDTHGEIRKVTYRDKIERECKVCVFATANSLQKVKSLAGGALFSRFGNPVTYDRPSDEMLRRILHRELNAIGVEECEKNNGKQCGKCKPCQTRKQWIDITIEFCHKHENDFDVDTLDPRFVIEICTNGLEQLTNNNYLRAIEATSVLVDEVAEWD